VLHSPHIKTKINRNPSSGLEKLYARGVGWIEEWNTEGLDMAARYTEKGEDEISQLAYTTWNFIVEPVPLDIPAKSPGLDQIKDMHYASIARESRVFNWRAGIPYPPLC
jgi:hypothetical protein